MRIVAAVALFALLPVSPFLRAQDQPAEPSLTIRSLTIESADLPDAARESLGRAFQGGSYAPEELAERVRQALREMGYFKAAAQLDGVKEADDERSADIKMRVTAGAQYHLDQIRFTGASLFPVEQLRALFPIDGSLYNATAIGRGLDELQKLYVDRGYVSFRALPKPEVDEAGRTISLTIDIDQGKTCYFGRLFLDGIEPQPGAALALQNAWAELRDKPYSSRALNGWLSVHSSEWPHADQAQISIQQNHETQLVDVRLQMP